MEKHQNVGTKNAFTPIMFDYFSPRTTHMDKGATDSVRKILSLISSK